MMLISYERIEKNIESTFSADSDSKLLGFKQFVSPRISLEDSDDYSQPSRLIHSSGEVLFSDGTALSGR